MKENRIKEIEKYLVQKKSVSLTELCETFGVSLNTIRRDINELCARGTASKVYGGIILNKDNEIVPFNMRSISNINEKIGMARLASRFIEDGETLYIDSGTTTFYLLSCIPSHYNITIISNSLNVYNEALKFPNLNVISTGGLLYPKTNSFIGISAVRNLNEYHINKAFMAATAVNLESGATNNSFHESEIKKAVIRLSNKIVLMADHTKIGKSAAISFCPLETLYAFITDKKPPVEYIRFMQEKNIQCLYKDD